MKYVSTLPLFLALSPPQRHTLCNWTHTRCEHEKMIQIESAIDFRSSVHVHWAYCMSMDLTILKCYWEIHGIEWTFPFFFSQTRNCDGDPLSHTFHITETSTLQFSFSHICSQCSQSAHYCTPWSNVSWSICVFVLCVHGFGNSRAIVQYDRMYSIWTTLTNGQCQRTLSVSRSPYSHFVLLFRSAQLIFRMMRCVE